MAAQELEIFVQKEKYQNQINLLETKITQLQAKADEMEQLKREASTVFGDSDDNLAKAQENVEGRIRLINQAINASRASVETLQKMLQSTEDISVNVNKLLEEAMEAAAKLFI